MASDPTPAPSPTPTQAVSPPPPPPSTTQSATSDPAPALTEPSLVGGEAEPKTDPAPSSEAEGAPEFKLDLPEGVEFEPAALEEFRAVLTDDKLSPSERGSRLAAMHAAQVQKSLEQAHNAFFDLNKRWVDEVKADPEIGGDKLEPTMRSIGKLIDQYGSPEVRQAMNLTGAGNNPHIVRMLAKMAAALTEPGHVTGTRPTTAPRDLAEAMYPNLPSAQG